MADFTGLKGQQMPSVIDFSNAVSDCDPVHIPEFDPERDIEWCQVDEVRSPQAFRIDKINFQGLQL